MNGEPGKFKLTRYQSFAKNAKGVAPGYRASFHAF